MSEKKGRCCIYFVKNCYCERIEWASSSSFFRNTFKREIQRDLQKHPPSRKHVQLLAPRRRCWRLAIVACPLDRPIKGRLYSLSLSLSVSHAVSLSSPCPFSVSTAGDCFFSFFSNLQNIFQPTCLNAGPCSLFPPSNYWERRKSALRFYGGRKSRGGDQLGWIIAIYWNVVQGNIVLGRQREQKIRSGDLAEEEEQLALEDKEWGETGGTAGSPSALQHQEE